MGDNEKLFTGRNMAMGGEFAYDAGREAGMREVVEWVEGQRMAAKTLIQGIGFGIAISDEKWQAKLEEWGIEEDK